MKHNLNKLMLLLIVFFVTISCQKQKEEFIDDENIEVYSFMPGFSIYKTKNNYFNYYAFRPRKKGTFAPYFTIESAGIKVENGDTIYTSRYHLKNGYVLAPNFSEDAVFTDITFAELVRVEASNNKIDYDSLLYNRIIDKDPFIKFYKTTSPTVNRVFKLKEINQLIVEDKLDEVFKKIK